MCEANVDDVDRYRPYVLTAAPFAAAAVQVNFASVCVMFDATGAPGAPGTLAVGARLMLAAWSVGPPRPDVPVAFMWKVTVCDVVTVQLPSDFWPKPAGRLVDPPTATPLTTPDQLNDPTFVAPSAQAIRNSTPFD